MEACIGMLDRAFNAKAWCLVSLLLLCMRMGGLGNGHIQASTVEVCGLSNKYLRIIPFIWKRCTTSSPGSHSSSRVAD